MQRDRLDGQHNARSAVGFGEINQLAITMLLTLMVCFTCLPCDANEPLGSVCCFVRLLGAPPKTDVITLDTEMAAAMKATHYHDERFLVGRDQGDDP